MSTNQWYADIARKAGVEEDFVAEIMERYGVPGTRMLPARRRLRVDYMHFAGVKNLAANGRRMFEPFLFSHRFEGTVTAFASLGQNDAGKSSILDILLWGLRGRTALQDDVRSWLHECCILFTVAGERILVGWRVTSGVPHGAVVSLTGVDVEDLRVLTDGTAAAMSEAASAMSEAGTLIPAHAAPIDGVVESMTTAGGVLLASFDGDTEMGEAIAAVMLERLDLSVIKRWQQNRGAVDDADGTLTEQGWPLWSQALAITSPSIKSTLGEVPNAASAVLGTYLGTAWGPAAQTARARKREVDAELAGARRRAEADRVARESDGNDLESELRQLEQALAAMPDGDILDRIDRAVARVRELAADLAEAERAALSRAVEYGQSERALQEAEANVAALKEAAVTKRFWHSLKPTCCPRCDAAVDQARWEREQEGACSLCAEPIGTTTIVEPPGVPDSEDDIDEVAAAEARAAALLADAVRLGAEHDDLLSERDRLRIEYDTATETVKGNPGDVEARRALEREIAVLQGRIHERTTLVSPSVDEARDRVSKVLGAAEAVATDRRKAEQAILLQDASERITELGQRLGVAQLEKATLRGNAHLPMIKGGTPMNFGDVTDGERLRLKIAVVVALLHVGTGAGVGRHPGFLVIDSLTREELNPDDARTLVHELAGVADAYELQVITSSAQGELLEELLPAGSVRLPQGDGLMW